MKSVPKVVNKLPIYLVLVVLIGVTFFILTGKFKLEVVNVSADSTAIPNYIRLTTLEDQTIDEILTTRKTIGFVSAQWCSNCEVLSIELKDFLKARSDFKVYEFDLDTDRTLLREIEADTTPTLILPATGQYNVRSNISLQDLDDIILTELSN